MDTEYQTRPTLDPRFDKARSILFEWNVIRTGIFN